MLREKKIVVEGKEREEEEKKLEREEGGYLYLGDAARITLTLA